MAFYVWYNPDNLPTDIVTTIAGQCDSGFEAGAAIYAKNENYILRQNSLMGAAMMAALNLTQYSAATSFSTLTNAVTSALSRLSVSHATTATTAVKYEKNVGISADINTKFNSVDSAIANIGTQANPVEYATNYNTNDGGIKSKFDDIEGRLDALGFKQGVITPISNDVATMTNPKLYKQGTICYFSFNLFMTRELSAGSEIEIGTFSEAASTFMPLTNKTFTYVRGSGSDRYAVQIKFGSAVNSKIYLRNDTSVTGGMEIPANFSFYVCEAVGFNVT